MIRGSALSWGLAADIHRGRRSRLRPFPKRTAIALGLFMLASLPASPSGAAALQVLDGVVKVGATLAICALATWAEQRIYKGLLGGAWMASAAAGTAILVMIDVVISAMIPDFRSRIQAAVLTLLTMVVVLALGIYAGARWLAGSLSKRALDVEWTHARTNADQQSAEAADRRRGEAGARHGGVTAASCRHLDVLALAHELDGVILTELHLGGGGEVADVDADARGQLCREAVVGQRLDPAPGEVKRRHRGSRPRNVLS